VVAVEMEMETSWWFDKGFGFFSDRFGQWLGEKVGYYN
jgi:hypothetical protein